MVMRSHIRLGRFFGVEVGLHYSWGVIALMIAFSLATHFRAVHPDWDGPTVWASSLLTAVLFFVALVAHELAHSLVAKSRGLPVRSITLFALGGVAQIEREPQDAKTEFWMAIAGPAASAAIGAACLGVSRAAGWIPAEPPATPALAVLVWLGYINLSLAVFNLIPGYPLDGGRVLRAILWWITRSATRATRIAAQTGRVVAVGFIALGVVRFATGSGFNGLWMSFIGWFLLDAAGASYAQVRMTEALTGLRVRDVMVRDCPVVDARLNLQSFVQEHLAGGGPQCLLVAQDGNLTGMISPMDVQRVPRAQWPYHTVGDAMRPLDEVSTVAPDTLVSDALEAMGRERVNQLPVAEGGRLEGVISRAGVVGFLQSRAQLRI
jgi:Zn-dependent protease/predicted transcriptional regulator